MEFTIIHNYPDGEVARVLENKLSPKEINLLKEMVKEKSIYGDSSFQHIVTLITDDGSKKNDYQIEVDF